MTDKTKYLPTVAEPDCKPGEIAKDTKMAMKLAELPQIDYKDAKQIADRCQWYFEYCAEHDVRPTIQALCLSLGCVRQTLINWESEDSERGRIITRAKQIIRTLIEQWSVSGRLSPPISIFWSKNVLGYVDTVQVTAVQQESPLQASKTPKEIEEEICAQIPLDE